MYLVAGCRSGNKPLAYLYRGDSELTHYKQAATKIDYPDVHTHLPQQNALTDSPRRIRDPRKDELWDVTLEEALHRALANNPIIRNNAQFLSPANPLLTNPEAAVSVFDPAIQESGVLFGQRGVEAALADFDAQFTTSMLWSRDEQIQNNRFLSGGLAPGATLTEENAVFNAQLRKQMATGGTLSLTHNWNYSLNNVPSRLFGSVYTGSLRADYRHPLWAGSGTEFTRIAGPVGNNVTGVTGVNQGVVIARINNDISIADFEASVRNLAKDVEDLYWDLAFAYHTYDAEIVARNSALNTWRDVEALARVGAERGGTADEAQARDNYFESRARAENALADIYELEGRLRRLLGLPVNDGRIIRPVDEPVVAEFLPDWHVSLAEALTRRVELRRQKWNIKRLQLQLKAAQSLTKPRLDFISAYQVNGFGDNLFAENDNDGVTAQGLGSAYNTLTQGNQAGWNLGFEFSMPFGFRSALAQMRNIELQLAKARTALATQELEISHELSNAFQAVDRWYKTAQTNFNRHRAAALRVRAFEAEYEAGRTTLDLLLRAQISLAQAEIEYYRSLYEYNKAISEIHFRKGSLLERNSVALAEGGWNPEAYSDALRRAWARSFAFAHTLQHTEPTEFVSQEHTAGVELAPPISHAAVDGRPEDLRFEMPAGPEMAPPPTVVPQEPGNGAGVGQQATPGSAEWW